MSIIFGILKPMGATVSRHELEHLAHSTERYAPDGLTVYAVKPDRDGISGLPHPYPVQVGIGAYN